MDVLDFPCSSDGKESACNSRELGLIPGSGRCSGEGNDSPLQYSCLENPMDREAQWATGHGVAESDMTKQLPLFLLRVGSQSDRILILQIRKLRQR